MNTPQLILLEGLPGSGKSTAAHFLARRFAAQGVAVAWWYEEARGNPVYVFDNPGEMQQVIADVFSGKHGRVIAAALARWRRFAEELSSSRQTVILDSCLYGYLTWTLFPADVPLAEIAEYVGEVARIIAPLQPRLINLRREDVAAALWFICDRRGAEIEQQYIRRTAGSPYGKRRGLQGFAGLVAFWTAYREFTDTLIGELPFSALSLDTSGAEWGSYQHRIAEFCGLAPAAPPCDSGAPLERYAGTYVATDGSARPCVVSLARGHLVIDDLPQVWPHTRLIPTGHNVFETDSLPIRVTFAEDADGDVCALRTSGPDLIAGSVTAAYAKR